MKLKLTVIFQLLKECIKTFHLTSHMNSDPLQNFFFSFSVDSIKVDIKL